VKSSQIYNTVLSKLYQKWCKTCLYTACDETVIKDHTVSKCRNRSVCIITAPQNTHTPQYV